MTDDLPSRASLSGVVEVSDRLVAPSAWLTLRPIKASDSGAPKLVEDARLVAWGPPGIQDVEIPFRMADGIVVVDVQPKEQLGVGLLAPGFAVCDVSALLSRGGAFDCCMQGGARYEVEIRDGRGGPVEDVEVHMYSGAITVGSDGGRQVDASSVVWPVERSGNRRVFLLPPGHYRHRMSDPSVAILSNNEALSVDDVAHIREVLVVGSLMVAAMRFVDAEPDQVVPQFPDALVPIATARVQDVAKLMRESLPTCRFLFAATTAWSDRAAGYDVPVRLGAAGERLEDMTAHRAGFQRIEGVCAQDFVWSVSDRMGRLRVSVVDPEGGVVPGVRFLLQSPGHAKANGSLVSGEWTAVGAGTHDLVPLLPSAILAERRREVRVGPRESVAIEMQLLRVMTEVDLRVEYEDQSVPEFVVVSARNGDWTDVCHSKRPASIRILVPLGTTTIQVQVPTKASATVEVRCERREGSPRVVVAKLPKR